MSIAANAHVKRRDKPLNNRVIHFGRVVVVSSGDQHAAILEQRGGVAGAALLHLWSGSEGLGLRIIYFRGIECGTPGVRTAADDENAAVGQHCRRVVDAVLAHPAGVRESAGGGIIEFRPARSTAADQHLAVS